MDKQARLGTVSPAWRFLVARIRAFASALPSRITRAFRLGRRLLALSQPWTWRFALLPIAVAVAVLIADGAPISWGVVAAEGLASVCALSGWAVLRAYTPVPQGDIPYLGAGASLLALAALAALSLLASAAALTLSLSALALALIALDLAPASLLALAPPRVTRTVRIVARRIVAPILLGAGLVVVTAQAQQTRPDMTLWLLGVALSLLMFATIQARAMVVADAIRDQKAPMWRRPIIMVVGALALAGALVIGIALPASAPHGLLLALGTLPMALVAVTGLWRSTFIPARDWSARRLESVFTRFALALVAGALASAAVAAIGASLGASLGVALTQALGG